MMKKLMYVDVDGTLNEFAETFKNEVRSLGFSFHPGKEDFYFFEDAIIATKAEQKEIKEHIFSKSDFWENLPVLPGSQVCIKYLNNLFDLYIVTAPWENSDKHKNEKIEWVNTYFPFLNNEQIVFSSEKWKLQPAIIIEDRVDTLENCQDEGFTTVKFEQPYNKDLKTDYVLYSWQRDQVMKMTNYIYGVR
jgi:5'(3')-deoxyribonucleotidase